MSGINPNIDGSGSIGPVGPLGPVTGQGEEGQEQDVTGQSTLSPSQQEALMVLYLMNTPVLAPPDQEGGWSIDPVAIGAIVAARTAEIGSEMWDSYLDYLAEQKERIQEHLESPRYQAWIEQQSPAFIAKMERASTPETQNAILSSSEFNAWIQSLPATQRDDELNRGRAARLWTDMIDGVSNYIKDNQDSNPGAVAFMAASFVITSTFIGDYMNIVDVASTNMVAVNPIQDSVGSVIQSMPQALQESFALTVNLFAIGLIHFANAEAIGKALETGKPPATQETVEAFAKSTLDKVKSNEVNAFLMAILVNKYGETGEVSDDKMLQLIAMAKLTMLSIAMAALYQSATGWMTPEVFQDLIQGKTEAQSEEDKKLFVEHFTPLHEAFMEILEENMVPKRVYEELMESLGIYFLGTLSIDDLLDPTKVYQGIGKTLENEEHRG